MMRTALIFIALASVVQAQTTAGPVTQIVTGGTVKVTGGTLVAQSGTPIILGGTPVIGGGGGPVIWTQIQSKWGPVTTSGTTLSVTLSSAPIAGNLVVCGVMAFPQQASTVADNASTPNAYAITPHSPSAVQAGAVAVSLAYLVAPAGAGATITATQGTALTFNSIIGCEEFHKSAGTPAFDTDAAGNGNTGNIANTPSITGSAAGELLVGVAYIQLGVATGDSPWSLWPPGLMGSTGSTTGCGSTNTCVFGDEVILSSSGTATALSFTNVSSAGQWNSMIAAFK